MAAFRHIVLFRFDDGIEVEQVIAAVKRIQALRTLPGILDWRVETSTDLRKGVVVVQNVLFESEIAFSAYRASDEHKKLAESLSGIANWLVADYRE